MFLLDTNVISELRKARAGRADRNVATWIRTVPAGSLFLSVIVIQELEIGTLLVERRDPAQGAILRSWLDEHVLTAFFERILPVDTAVARRSAALHVPDPRPIRDGLIAATALVHGMTVVTRNVDDFRLTGVEVLNPWEWEPGSVTLHAEMEEILRDQRNKWMTPAKLASEVNSRGQYRRGDGTDVPGSQITARARQYGQVFECRSGRSGLQIRLQREP
jgi:predicted nucleic acid-binding protein